MQLRLYYAASRDREENAGGGTRHLTRAAFYLLILLWPCACATGCPLGKKGEKSMCVRESPLTFQYSAVSRACVCKRGFNVV